MGKFSKIISYLFFAIVVGVAGLLIASIFPIAGGTKVFVVLSGSMEPAIKTGSIIMVKPAGSYRIGDIITFGPYSKQKPPTTHRIQEIRVQTGNPVYTTKGDANNALDTREVSNRDVIGKVRFSLPYLGYVVAAAKKPAGFIAMIILPAAIIVYDEGKKIWRELAKMREKKSEDKT